MVNKKNDCDNLLPYFIEQSEIKRKVIDVLLTLVKTSDLSDILAELYDFRRCKEMEIKNGK